MKKDILIAATIFLVLIGSAVFKLYFSGIKAIPIEPAIESSGNGQVLWDEANIAVEIARQINSVSPTQTFEEVGWIVKRIVFVSGLPQAFVEYTDTHIAMRLLLEYTYQTDKLELKVLATYLPQGDGSWELQYGKDETSGRGSKPFIYSNDAGQWIPENSQ